MLLPLCPDTGNFSLLVLGVIACVVGRTILMKKEIERVVRTPMWKSLLTRDKRVALFIVVTSAKPTDIDKFEEMCARYVNLPTKIVVAVMYGIVNLLLTHLDDTDKMKLMGALAAFTVGGVGIGGTRHGSLAIDCIFRLVFGAGFCAILYYLAEVSDIVLIKSME